MCSVQLRSHPVHCTVCNVEYRVIAHCANAQCDNAGWQWRQLSSSSSAGLCRRIEMSAQSNLHNTLATMHYTEYKCKSGTIVLALWTGFVSACLLTLLCHCEDSLWIYIFTTLCTF